MKHLKLFNKKFKLTMRNKLFLFFIFYSFHLFSNINDDSLQINKLMTLLLLNDTNISYNDNNYIQIHIEPSRYSCEMASDYPPLSFEISMRIHYMTEIYRILKNEDSFNRYYLYDCNKLKKFRDIIHVTQSSKIYKFLDVFYEEEDDVKVLVNSYIEWYEIFKKFGLKYIKDSKINPIQNTKFRYIKNTGYISKNISDCNEINNVINDMLTDSIGTLMYIKNNNIKLNENDWKNWVIKIGILRWIQQEQTFTSDLSLFDIYQNNESITYSKSLSIFKSINCNNVKDILEQEKLQIVLNQNLSDYKLKKTIPRPCPD